MATRSTGIRRARFEVDQDQGGEALECTGQSCQSCTGSLVADCVALCCCPCAVVSLLLLAFVKVPWMIGARWWGKVKGKAKKRKGKVDVAMEARNGVGNEEWEAESSWDAMELVAQVQKIKREMGNRLSDCRQAEKMLVELLEVSHLGFGRLSFTGIQG